MRGDIPFADSVSLLRLWRYLHARRKKLSVLAEDPNQKLLAAVTAELVARGLL